MAHDDDNARRPPLSLRGPRGVIRQQKHEDRETRRTRRDDEGDTRVRLPMVTWREDNDGALTLLSYPPRRLFSLSMLSFTRSEFRKRSGKGQFLLSEFLLLVMYIMLSLSHEGRLVKYVF